MSGRPTRCPSNRHVSWFPILLIVIGLGYGVGGLWLLSWHGRRPPVAAATHTPQPQSAATATALPSTSTPTVPANIVPTSTPAPTASPTVVVRPAALTQITIVHSNDTWGYTLPCG
jgi:hypothetical protein